MNIFILQTLFSFSKKTLCFSNAIDFCNFSMNEIIRKSNHENHEHSKSRLAAVGKQKCSLITRTSLYIYMASRYQRQMAIYSIERDEHQRLWNEKRLLLNSCSYCMYSNMSGYVLRRFVFVNIYIILFSNGSSMCLLPNMFVDCTYYDFDLFSVLCILSPSFSLSVIHSHKHTHTHT